MKRLGAFAVWGGVAVACAAPPSHGRLPMPSMTSAAVAGPRAPSSPADSLAALQASALALDADELDVLGRTGIVVSDHRRFVSFAR